MNKLKDILFGVTLQSLHGDRTQLIKGITFDSREVKDGFVFVAILGTQVDGHDYIDEAIQNGSTTVMVEQLPENMNKQVTYVQTTNNAQALGIIASNFYERPSEKLKLIGITGTNGKTTCVTLLFKLFQKLGYSCGLLSTIENRINDSVLPASHTTPDALTLNKLLAKMVRSGCTHCFMEVSSHALDQHRVFDIQFAGGVFTNIAHDHLDYHLNFDRYIAAKKKLFDMLRSNAFALVNVDDKRGKIMLQNTKAAKYTFGIKSMADYKAKILQNSLDGLMLSIENNEVWFHLIGSFNAYNLLTVYATAVLLKEDKIQVLKNLTDIQGAKGRFERIENPHDILAIVDYAHTPDALKKILDTLDHIRTKNEVLITVVGCGGDRDQLKRPKMAKIASTHSDKLILTTDNPRTESPKKILDDMKKGIPKQLAHKVLTIEDRKEAIKEACGIAHNKDIVLIAGKGHETYQEINGTKKPFDDRQVLYNLLNKTIK